MLRAHRIMIEQGSAWAILGLTDKREKSGTSAFGRWLHARDSTEERKISFTSDSKEYLYWEWKSESPATMLIGSKTPRASHKAGEEEYFQVLITLTGLRRNSEGKFGGSGSQDAGSGKGILTYNVSPYFEKGAIEWTVVAY
ncbi:hypothetical protein QO058_14115 [Bosea vestrisii]|uniref:hypothetical protein n=1 Tax=Bosea vestrisii TaxID=151416 RepID=UPI0024DFAF4F|nr:hypothetical protein [Bosea vestrisii]WID99271.1 hypothetical protein QO058_14115 [Bosea vestrisii]